MKALIILKSEVFGEETFEYDTLKEADKGFNRLIKACNGQYKKDKIDRELSMEDSKGTVRRSAKMAGDID